MKQTNPLILLNNKIHNCQNCTRLRTYCQKIAKTKRKSFNDQTYWGKPVSGFGDPNAKLVIVGLAPAAHGANRTGRVFTGDNSGLWLYRALYKAGFSNQYHVNHINDANLNDGLVLKNAYITCAVKCAPPDNKPTIKEFEACRPYLHQELDLLKNKKVILVLGQLALREVSVYLKQKIIFKHGAISKHGDYTVVCSYHPSQQNTFTKRLTEPMFDKIFEVIKKLILDKNK